MNWVETIALLKRAGYTQPEIADACGCAQSTISDLATGTSTEPRYSTGVRLRQLVVRANRKLARESQV